MPCVPLIRRAFALAIFMSFQTFMNFFCRRYSEATKQHWTHFSKYLPQHTSDWTYAHKTPRPGDKQHMFTFWLTTLFSRNDKKSEEGLFHKRWHLVSEDRHHNARTRTKQTTLRPCQEKSQTELLLRPYRAERLTCLNMLWCVGIQACRLVYGATQWPITADLF